MQSQLAKSLYLGLAALSLGAVAAVTTTATTADAASKAKIVSKAALGKDSKNVEVTGTNAIYTKPGTVRGAKLVAAKKTVKKLASSTHSKDYFRAYYTAVTSKGTVYYKIVSMNGKYRGYIYGGKVKGTIDAGIKEAQTTKEATMPTRTAGFHIKDVKKNSLWTAPQHTTYKAHKVNMYGATKDDTFTVSKAETKTKEGSLYYYVTSDKNSDVAGWIFAGEGYKDASSTDFGGLSINEEEPAATADNSVKIVYREADKQVGNATWISIAKDIKAGQAVVATQTNTAKASLVTFATSKVPSGYKAKVDGTVADAIKGATYGNTVYVDVVAAATSKVEMKVEDVANTVGSSTVAITNPLQNGKLTSADLSINLDATKLGLLDGDKGTKFSETNLTSLASALAVDSSKGIQGSKTYRDATGKQYHYVFKLNSVHFASDNRNKVYGDNLVASYTATLAEGVGSVTNTDTSWFA
ncbi:S-layer protein [Levilactobacillus cerevisiae]|uniref:S-layer protein n=1 Tax=Levilactobacillus cerevisiae TaxID=1704076 RepID=UPI000F786A83|nr:S-layer protein [Levilactobacillus cerevisiae]